MHSCRKQRYYWWSFFNSSTSGDGRRATVRYCIHGLTRCPRFGNFSSSSVILYDVFFGLSVGSDNTHRMKCTGCNPSFDILLRISSAPSCIHSKVLLIDVKLAIVLKRLAVKTRYHRGITCMHFIQADVINSIIWHVYKGERSVFCRNFLCNTAFDLSMLT